VIEVGYNNRDAGMYGRLSCNMQPYAKYFLYLRQ